MGLSETAVSQSVAQAGIRIQNQNRWGGLGANEHCAGVFTKRCCSTVR
jgi:hypothetical protein